MDLGSSDFYPHFWGLDRLQSRLESIDGRDPITIRNPGYKDKNWATLQSELKDLFWQHDKQKDTAESLNKLIQDSSTMSLNVYLLKNNSISDT